MYKFLYTNIYIIVMAENAVTLVTCLHITITYFEFYIYTRKSNNIKIQIIYGKDNNIK